MIGVRLAAWVEARLGRESVADLALLAPDVVLRAYSFAVESRGAVTVVEIFSGRAQAARPALVDGLPGAVWAPAGRRRAAFRLTIADGTITAIDVIADPAALAGLDIVILEDS